MTVRARGFTLVEVLIAMGITAAMAAMTIGSLRSLDRASEIARAQDERYAAARVALRRMARELTMAFLSRSYDTRRYREPLTVFVGREDEVMFTTMAHTRLYRDARESDQAVVQYELDADPDRPGEQALFRREKVRLDDEPDRGGRRDLVADRIVSMRLEYWDSKRKDWAREWRATQTEFELPARVRIELEMATAERGRTEKFVTEARIEVRKALGY